MFNVSETEDLFDAAESNDLSRVKFFIEEKEAPVTVTNDQGETLGHIGAKNNNLDLIQFILDKQGDAEGKDDQHLHSILQLAVEKNSVDVVKYLVSKRNVDISRGDCPDYRTTALHTSVKFGHLNMLKYFVEEKNGDVNTVDWQHTPLVFFAVKYQHNDIVKYLIEERRANLTMVDRNEENILYSATRKGDLPIIKYLLDERKADLDIDWRNYGGETLLHEAVVWNRVTVLQYLVSEKHANVNVPDKWHFMTPLHYAASRNNFVIFAYLIEHGADTQFPDDSGRIPVEKTADERLIAYCVERTKRVSRRRRSVASASLTANFAPSQPPLPIPYYEFMRQKIYEGFFRISYPLNKQLFEAIERNNLERVKFFIEKANIPVTTANASGQTLGHIAAKCNRVDILKYILEKDPDILDKVDQYNNTVLHLAVVKGSFEVVKYLVEEHQANIAFMGGRDKDRTALHVAVEFNHLNILKYFVEERNVDFNVPHEGQTQPPIFLAIKSKHWDVIEYLIEEKNANLEILNSKKENILFPVVRLGLVTFLKFLLDEKKVKLDVNWKNVWGETVVHVATQFNKIYILKYLVDKKHADVNIQKDSDNKTALHYAASHDRYVICKFLVERGANLYLKDESGLNPVHQAKDENLIAYLEKAAKSRTRRNVDTFLPSLQPVSLSFESSRRRIFGGLPRAVESIDGTKSVAITAFHFQGFLMLAKSAMRSVRQSEHDNENIMMNYLSPSSSLRSRMSSIAIDVINGTSNCLIW